MSQLFVYKLRGWSFRRFLPQKQSLFQHEEEEEEDEDEDDVHRRVLMFLSLAAVMNVH